METEDEPLARFWLVELRSHGEEGWRPDFPPEASFLLLADAQGIGFGIYQATLPRRTAESHRAEPLSPEVSRLLESGQGYPPALALAREDVGHRFARTKPTREQFVEAYAQALRRFFSEQSSAPYLLAESTRDEPGYLERGDWVWILKVERETRSALWISSDFFVYRSSVEHFALTPAHIQRLSRVPDVTRPPASP